MTFPTEIPKQARARVTRARLLDAAVEELVAHGYGRLTTVGVARRAGVSRGAQQNYFPHKRVLVSEAVSQLALRHIDDLQVHVKAVPAGSQRVGVALDVLFAQYSGNLFAAVVELSLAARDEPELREVVRRGERAVSEAVHAITADIFGEPAARKREFAELWATVLGTIRGLALLRLLDYPVEYVDDQWRSTRRHLLDLLAPYT